MITSSCERTRPSRWHPSDVVRVESGEDVYTTVVTIAATYVLWMGLFLPVIGGSLNPFDWPAALRSSNNGESDGARGRSN